MLVREVISVNNLFKSAGIDKDIIFVTSDDRNEDVESKAAEGTVVAATACAIAESFAIEEGMDTFVVVDSIDQHKKIWDATTRVLVDVFGVDAVVKGDRDGGASSERIQRRFRLGRADGPCRMASVPYHEW